MNTENVGLIWEQTVIKEGQLCLLIFLFLEKQRVLATEYDLAAVAPNLRLRILTQ